MAVASQTMTLYLYIFLSDVIDDDDDEEEWSVREYNEIKEYY